jgi:bilirubin oxidase
MQGLIGRIALWTGGTIGALALIVVAATILNLMRETTTYPNANIAFASPLAIPPLLAPRIEAGVKIFDLEVEAGGTSFLPGRETATLGFNGAYLGPTLRATRGDNLRVLVANTLPEPVTVHWHGMDLPAKMDGGPHQMIAPGADWQPEWEVRNAASTLWYHSHMAGKTGEQVYRGLAGLFLIDDEEEAALALPRAYGVDDIPLVVQDRLFDANGQFIYRHDNGVYLSPGMLGDTILVNGTLGPYLQVAPGPVRLRLLNGSNARRYDFAFEDGRAFYQIASDGGLLAAPVERTSLLLAPAERAEILVDLSDAPKRLKLLSLPIVDAIDPFSNLFQSIVMGSNDEHQQFDILELRTTGAAVAPMTVPATLHPLARMDAGAAVKEREFILDQDGRTISGKAMDHSRIDHVVKRGDVEIWTVRNFSSAYHPFHVHGVQFQILDRNGKPPPDYELGWKDTVMVPTTEMVRLIMRFDAFADPNWPYMFHCHILEHEDMGMMGQFVVVDDPDAPVGIVSAATQLPAHQH